MRLAVCGVALTMAALAAGGCTQSTAAKQAPAPTSPTIAADPPASTETAAAGNGARKESIGFDRNEYPGDDTMATMRNTFAFTGYWLTVPPGAMFNQWIGKRDILRAQGWGFLVLANGKLEAEILKAQKSGAPPAALGKLDALKAIASAKVEGFPAHTILFVDQEEGGRLTGPQADYLLAWTETVAASDFRPGVYASGQLTPDDPGTMIDTIQDIRERVAKGHLHDVAMFDAQDTCPPAPGCTLAARPLKDAGEPNLTAWQYSQSPQRPSLTKRCTKTYAADGKCYAPGFPKIFLDMDVATTDDPSHGR